LDPEQRGCKGVELIYVSQDRIIWQVPVITVAKIQVFLHSALSLGDYRTASQKTWLFSNALWEPQTMHRTELAGPTTDWEWLYSVVFWYTRCNSKTM